MTKIQNRKQERQRKKERKKKNEPESNHRIVFKRIKIKCNCFSFVPNKSDY